VWLYSFFNLGSRWEWVVNATLGLLYPRERDSVFIVQGLGGPRSDLDECGKLLPHRDSIPGPSSPQRVAIPTELSGPTKQKVDKMCSRSPYLYVTSTKLFGISRGIVKNILSG